MPKLRKPPTDPVEIVTDDRPDEPITIELEDAPLEAVIDVAPEKKTTIVEPEEDAVKKALEATQRAEELQRSLAEANRRADEQARLARERQEELTRERGDRVDAEYNSVLTAIAAEQSALDQAEAAYQAAAAAQDWATAAKAQRAMATASARVDRLEDNKSAFDAKREEAKKAPPVEKTRETNDFESQIRDLPDNAKTWLRARPEYWNDPAKNRRLQAAHSYVTEIKGHGQFSQEYFDEIETQLGLKAAPVTEPQPTQRRSMSVSAPVSRDVPGPSGQRNDNRITLSPEQREIARKSFSASDMTDEQKERLYALNLAKLRRMRANGEYRQTTEQTG